MKPKQLSPRVAKTKKFKEKQNQIQKHIDLQCTIQNIEAAYRGLELLNQKKFEFPFDIKDVRELVQERKRLLQYIKTTKVQLRKDLKFYK